MKAGVSEHPTPSALRNAVLNLWWGTSEFHIHEQARPEFVGHALGGIARQDYPAHLISEVVIVDDSPTHLAAPGLVEGEQEWRPPPDDGAPGHAPFRSGLWASGQVHDPMVVP